MSDQEKNTHSAASFLVINKCNESMLQHIDSQYLTEEVFRNFKIGRVAILGTEVYL